ncbi:MAG TPA: hypothetical protein VF135_07920 [Terriglobales bacterium]
MMSASNLRRGLAQGTAAARRAFIEIPLISIIAIITIAASAGM